MTDELDKSVEVIERWDAGGTEYSVDGGTNWWTKDQLKAIQALLADQMIEYQAQLLKDYKDDIAKECNKARIDELKLARSVDSQLSSADIVNHLENRLAELQEKNK